MKKIAIITSGALPVPATKGGGVETLVQILLEQNEKNQDFNCTVFTVRDNTAVEKQKEYKCANFVNIENRPVLKKIIIRLNTYIYALNRRIFKNPALTLQLPFNKWILKKGNLKEFDVVLVESNFNILSKLKTAGAKKVIYHAHYNDVNPSITNFEKKKYNYGYSFVDGNISVSKFIENNIKSVIDYNLEYQVAENCAKSFKLIDSNEKNKVAKEYNIPKDKKIIMYSGRVTPEKGVTQLINAYKKLNDLNDICLVIVGGAFYSDNSQNEYVTGLKAIANQCNNPVIFTGYVEHEKMLKLWQLANLAVLPTYDVEEAAGLVVVEALAAKVPVIHTDSGGMQEYSSPECAVVVPRGEDFVNRLALEIKNLCSFDEKLKKLSDFALLGSKNWSEENYYNKCKDFLNRL